MFVRSFRIAACAALALAWIPAPAPAAVTGNFSFVVAKAPHALPLDASLADPAWAAGKVPNGAGPWENVTTRSPATLGTTAYLLYDDKNLYIGFKAEQAGVPIVATQTTNDVGFGVDDFVGIGIVTERRRQSGILLRDDAARRRATNRPTRTCAIGRGGARRARPAGGTGARC